LVGLPPRIPNYTWITKNRPKAGGGVAILIRNDILPKTTAIDNTDQDELESLWIRIKNPEKDIAIGVFYGKQENENRETIEKQFNSLTTQINQIRQDSRIILTGDFNAKLQIREKQINQEISNNGKLLNQLLQETNSTPISLSKDKGKWTRVNRNQPNQKSVIDYVITENEDNIINYLQIDEEGHIRPHHIKTKNGVEIITETDHNTITMSISPEFTPMPKPTTMCWKSATRTDWENYNKSLQNKIAQSDERPPHIITESIIWALNNSIGRKTIGNPQIKESKEIKEARRIKRQTRKDFDTACKTNGNKAQTLITYREAQLSLKTIILKEKK
jgi:hypothetical protein